MAVALVAAPPAIFAATDNGTLTVGTASASCGSSSALHYGFGPGMGSYNPTSLTGGKTLVVAEDVVDFLCTGSIYAWVQINGFSSNPGSTWLTTVTCNGATVSGSTSSFTYYSSLGLGVWYWHTGYLGLIGLTPGTNVSCSIVHN